MFKLAKFFLLSGIFLIVFLFLSPLFLDKKKIISFINQEIESSFEQKISYNDDVDLTFFPFPKITISQVKYFDPKVNLNIFVSGQLDGIIISFSFIVITFKEKRLTISSVS